MRDNIRAAGKVTGMAIFTSFLCLFIQVSVFSLMKSFSADVVGYQVQEIFEDGTIKEHPSVKEIPENPEKNFRYIQIYGNMPTSVKVVEVVISSIFSLGVLFCTTGTVFAKIAAKDRNDCDFNGGVPDKNRGLKIGAMAAVPPFVLYLGAVGLRLFGSGKWVDWYYWVYRFIIMGPVKPITDLFTSSVQQTYTVGTEVYNITGAEPVLSQVPAWAIAVQGGFILLFVLFGYLMYRICYNEDSVIAKLLYKSADDHNKGRRLGGR